MGEILISLGLLIFCAHLFSMIFSRKKIPDVLWLLIIGIVLGPISGIVSPSDLGKIGPIFSSVTLLVILLEGGLDISIKSLVSSWKSLVGLTFSAFFLSMAVVAAIGYFTGLSLLASLTIGAILGGTSSAVVIPLVSHLKVGKEAKTVLILESAITDVLCIVLAIAFLQSFQYGNLHVARIFGNILSSFTMASLIGISGGIVWSGLLYNVRKLQNPIFMTPAFVFILYGISESMNFSGAITALAFGIAISNIEYFQFSFLKSFQKHGMLKLVPVERSFITEISFLLKTFFFVYIGVSIPFNNLIYILYGLIITICLFIARLILTRFIQLNRVNSYDKTIISFMIPKGLAAAALAAMPEQFGMPGGEEIKDITYAVIFLSISFTSIWILFIEHFPYLDIGYRKFFKQRHPSPVSDNPERIIKKPDSKAREEDPDEEQFPGNS